MTFLRDPVPPLICCLLSTLLNAAHSHESSVFCTSLELLFCLDLASWPSILLPRSSILTFYSFASIKHLDLLFFCLDQASWPSISVSNWALFIISFLILHLCIVCVDSANVFKCPACERGRGRVFVLTVPMCLSVLHARERGMWEREIERVCGRKCPTARVCGKA